MSRAFFISMAVLLGAASDTRAEPPFLPSRHAAAIYVGKGVWRPGLKHLKAFFRKNEITYEEISARQIQQGILEKRGYGVLVIPGGKSWDYLAQIGDDGASRIRDFVSSGGGYLGICAGGFFATSLREGPYPTAEQGKPAEESAVYSYGIGLLNGVALDGANISQYFPEFRAGVRPISITPRLHADVPTLAAPVRSAPSPRDRRVNILMLEGSGWRIDDQTQKDQSVDVIGRYPQSQLPAILSFTYGKGRAFVSGPHLEIEEDQLYLGVLYADPESDWPLLRSAFAYVWRDSQIPFVFR